MDRTEVLARQAAGERIEVFEELCPLCGRNSWYTRALDRYTHQDGSENLTCWLTLSRGEPAVSVAVQGESCDSVPVFARSSSAGRRVIA